MQLSNVPSSIEYFNSIDSFAGAIHDLDVGWQMESRAGDFHAALKRRAFDGCVFGEMLVDPCCGSRSGTEIGQSTESYLCLTYYRRGGQHFTQRGKEMVAEHGEFILWDAAEPSLFDCPVPMHCYAVWFPKRLVEARVGSVSAFLGQNARHNEASTRLLAAHFQTLHKVVGDLPDAVRRSAIEASVELIFSCFLPRADEDLPHRTQLLVRAQAEIGRRLEAERLTPSAVADALGISVRYLHQIFSTSGTTFGAHAGQLRLERAAEALRSYRSLRVTDIAHRFGFCDSAHFARSFKRRYGCTPTAFRAAK